MRYDSWADQWSWQLSFSDTWPGRERERRIERKNGCEREGGWSEREIRRVGEGKRARKGVREGGRERERFTSTLISEMAIVVSADVFISIEFPVHTPRLSAVSMATRRR